jgi:hypothetical protein
MTLYVSNKKPEKPYDNFEHYLSIRRIKRNDKGQLECFRCRGNGSIRDPKADCDPVEGYKHADYIICTECGGKKYGPEYKRVYRQEYSVVVEDYKWALEKWKSRQKIISYLQTICEKDSAPFTEKEMQDFLNWL